MKTATLAAAAVAAVLLAPNHASAADRDGSERLDLKVNLRCNIHRDTVVVVRLHDTRPPNPEAQPLDRMRPYAWAFKHSDDGDPWLSWGGGDYLENGQTTHLRFRIGHDQKWVRVAVSDETDVEFADHLMLDRKYSPLPC
jgi:hypothetical protein